MSSTISSDSIDSILSEIDPEIRSGLEKMEKSTQCVNDVSCQTKIKTIHIALDAIQSSSVESEHQTQKFSYNCFEHYSKDTATQDIQELVKKVLSSEEVKEGSSYQCKISIDLLQPGLFFDSTERKEICTLTLSLPADEPKTEEERV
jgi:hypothetical protein